MTTPPTALRVGCKEARLLWLAPGLFLAIGLALSLAGFLGARSYYRAKAQSEFVRIADHLSNDIRQRIALPVYGMNGARGVYAASKSVERAEFRAYVDSRDLPKEFPGLLGFGFAQRVLRSDLPAFVAAEQADEAPDFQVRPEGDSADLYVAKFVDPRPANLPFWGLDLGANPAIRRAAESAVQTGLPALTGQISPVSGGLRRPGFLFFQPVYRRGADLTSSINRQAALVGLVFSRIDAESLFEHLGDGSEPMVHIEIFDGLDRSPSTLIFGDDQRLAGSPTPDGADDFGGRRFQQVTTLPVGGRTWTLAFSSTAKFEKKSASWIPWLVALGGIGLSGLAAFTAWSLATARGRAEGLARRVTKELRTAEAEARRLALVAERTHNAVIITDSAGRIEWTNAGFTRVSGYTAGEVIGRTPGSFLQGPETDPATVALMRAAIGRGEAFAVEVRNYHKSGRPYWLSIDAQPLRDDTGRVTRFMAIESDITARKLTEQSLADIRELQQAILDGTAYAIISSTPDGTIATFNHGAEQMLGYTRSEVVGLHSPALFHDSAEVVAQAIELTRELGHPVDPGFAVFTALAKLGFTSEREWTYLRKDGTRLPVFLSITALRAADGTITGYLGIAYDLTAQKLQTAELELAKHSAEALNLRLAASVTEAHAAVEVARQATLAKSQFLATMSHEIRTPMNGVIGMTSLLLDSPLTPPQREFTEIIRQSGDSLLTIINDILDFSKIESGHMELEVEEFSLRDCIEGTLDVLGPRAAEKNLDLLYEITEGTPGYVRGDSTRLRQILMNLLGNALKFTAAGEVVLTARAVPRTDGAVELAFAVRDSGIGIPPEAMGRLFRSFSQVDASTNRRFGGTGLGLAISKRLAELMGGRMWVESTADVGSTFFFTVVVAGAPARPRSVLDPALRSVAGKRLLAVDDNSTNRRIIATMATQWEVACVTCASGAEALGVLRGGARFDVAIFDLQMPGMDGATLAAAVRAEFPALDLPLLLLSSVGRRDFVPDPSLFAAFLTKPAKPAQILEALQRIIGAGEIAAAPAPARPNAPVAPTRPERILLAEDNFVNQKVALHMLARLGFRADVAANGLEVLAAVQRQSYDIILMDMQMPEMDGLKATHRLNELMPDAALRPWIIALTANALEGDRELCLASGMDDYLSKPLKLEALAAGLARSHRTVPRRENG